MIFHEVRNILLCFMNDMFFIMDNIIKCLSSYVLNMVNITIVLRNYLCFIQCNLVYFFIIISKKLLKSDIEFLKYIVIFSWHYVLPCALRYNKI
jgi:hypothetical protein